MKHHPQPAHRVNFAEYLKAQQRPPEDGGDETTPPVNLHHVSEAMRQARTLSASTGVALPRELTEVFMAVLLRALRAL